jgi:hypothetical protein
LHLPGYCSLGQTANPVTPLFAFSRHSDDLNAKETEPEDLSGISPTTISKSIIEEEFKSIARVFDRFFLLLSSVATITVVVQFLSNL